MDSRNSDYFQYCNFFLVHDFWCSLRLGPFVFIHSRGKSWQTQKGFWEREKLINLQLWIACEFQKNQLVSSYTSYRTDSSVLLLAPLLLLLLLLCSCGTNFFILLFRFPLSFFRLPNFPATSIFIISAAWYQDNSYSHPCIRLSSWMDPLFNDQVPGIRNSLNDDAIEECCIIWNLPVVIRPSFWAAFCCTRN